MLDEFKQIMRDEGDVMIWELEELDDNDIWLLPTGETINGGNTATGQRFKDHRCIENATIPMENLDRYDNRLWDFAHLELGLVRLSPENQYALIKEGQKLNDIQRSKLLEKGYRVEKY